MDINIFHTPPAGGDHLPDWLPEGVRPGDWLVTESGVLIARWDGQHLRLWGGRPVQAAWLLDWQLWAPARQHWRMADLLVAAATRLRSLGDHRLADHILEQCPDLFTPEERSNHVPH